MEINSRHTIRTGGEEENNCANGDHINNNIVTNWKLPHKIIDIDSETNSQLLRDFTGERTGFVQVGKKEWFLPSGYKKNAHYYYNFQARPDDIWVVTFPRSGTTWTQEMVWLLANGLDYETAENVSLCERFPFLEFSSFVHPELERIFLEENRDSIEKTAKIKELTTPVWRVLPYVSGRRFIKSHLPFELLPPNLLDIGCKVIYIARNPKDVAVSYFHLNRSFRTQGYSGEFDVYWDYFERNLQAWTPFFEHIQQGWEKRHEENLLFMFYEDMVKNQKAAIQNVAKFLNVQCTNEEMETLENHLKIDNFRNNKSVNFEILKELGIILRGEKGFVRDGKSGGWRQYFGEDLKKRADKWIEENLSKTDLRFPL